MLFLSAFSTLFQQWTGINILIFVSPELPTADPQACGAETACRLRLQHLTQSKNLARVFILASVNVCCSVCTHQGLTICLAAAVRAPDLPGLQCRCRPLLLQLMLCAFTPPACPLLSSELAQDTLSRVAVKQSTCRPK